MADLTLRNIKGEPLTFDEMDSNLLALDSDSPWDVAASFITYDGQVGIGSGAWPPTYTLDFGNGDGNVATIGTTNANLEVHIDGPYPFEMFTNGVERFTVTTDGKVGINEPNPAQPLDVVGNIQTTTTFIGNQAYCNSFYDGTMTISGGTIFNADGGNFSGRIRFGSLRDDSGVAITRFETTLTDTNTKLPTSGAVFSYVTEQLGNNDSDIQVQLDSLYAWTSSKFDSADTYFKDRLDSDYAWNVSEHTAIRDSLNSEIVARKNADSNLGARIDSEHAWNVQEHQALSDSLTAEIIARTNADSDLEVRIDNLLSDTDSALDSEHAWNVYEHQLLSDSLTADIIARKNADSDLGVRIDSEHAWNVSDHNAIRDSLNAEIVARKNADSDIQAQLDSEHAWNVDEHTAIRDSLNSEIVARKNSDSDFRDRFDSEHAWNIAEHQLLSDSLTAEIVARKNADSALGLRLDSDYDWNVVEHQALSERLDSAYSWNQNEHNILQSQFDNLTTDSVTEGNNNLYFTNSRVDARNDSTIDSDFLNDRMPLTNLSDVQINTPTLKNDDVLQWNGTVWSNQSIGIAGTIQFRGGVDATTEAAPTEKENGDFYVNTTSGTALGSWANVTGVDSGDGLVWDSANTSWTNLGKITQGSVIKVRPGTAISVDETDTSRPVVSVDKTITDTWYYTQSQINTKVDSLNERIDSNYSWNVSEHTQLQANIDAEEAARISSYDSLSSRIDSNYSWNVVEHQALSDSLTAEIIARKNADLGIQAQLDSLDAQNRSDHLVLSNADSDLRSSIDSVYTNLTININNLDSKLDNNLAVIDDRFDSLALSISGDISVEIGDIQVNIDSIEDRLDSEHAWNVSQHLELSNADSDLRLSIDSVYNNLTININNLDSKLDSNLAIIDDRFDSLSLSIGGEINVEINEIQNKLDNLTTDSVAEGTTNLYYTDSRVIGLVDSAYVQERVTFPEFDSSNVIEIVDSEFVNSLVDFPETQILENTDSLPEGLQNLYYTDSRVIGLVDSDYVMERVTIESALRFKGSTSVDIYNAPDSKQNGDIYINDSQAVANNTWIGIEGETIATAQAIGWSEDLSRWYALGGIADYEKHDSAYISKFQTYMHLDSSAPTSPERGETWLDRNVDLVKIYDGNVWFEFPAGAAGGGTTLVIDSVEPTGAIEGDLWLDKNVDTVKIYDGSIWFEFPAGSSGGAVSNSEIISIVDSALDAGQILLDASPTGGASDDF